MRDSLETRFQVLLDAVSDALVLTDRAGLVEAFNEAAVRLSGYGAEELHGKPVSRLVPLDQPGGLRKAFERILAGKAQEHLDTLWLTKDGRRIHVSLSICPVKDSEGVSDGASIIAREIVERDRLKNNVGERTVQLDERMCTIIESALDSVVVMDDHGVITFWNRQAELTFGWARKDAVGRRLSEMIIPERYREAHEAGLKRFLATGQGPVLNKRLELAALHRDGHEFQVELTVSPIRWGEAVTFNAFVRDITERRRAEQQRSLLAAIVASSDDAIIGKTLDGTITSWNQAAQELYGYTPVEVLGRSIVILVPPERTSELPQILRRVIEGEHLGRYETVRVKKNGERVDVSLTVSPIRDAAGTVVGASAISRDITSRKRADKTMAALNRSLQERAEELVRSNAELERFAYVASHDLQEPLRMVASYVQLLEQRYKGKLGHDADKFISYAVEGAKRMQSLIRDLLVYSRVRITKEVLQPVECSNVLSTVLANLHLSIAETGVQISVEALPRVVADQARLTQLFQNLIENAIKFRCEASPKIHIGAAQSGDAWVISVCDNGIGIEPRHAQRIFEVFQRLNDRDKYPGTGIGLAIAKKIVEQHGGRIWVESKLGRGATFCFTMPLLHEYEVSEC